MKKLWKWLVGALTLAVLITGAWFLYDYLQGQYEPDQIQDSDDDPVTSLYAAPDFTVLDVDGNEVALSDMKGKPVVINFWATWCYFCGSEMPDFEEMYQQYGDEVVFMMVNVTDGVQDTVSTAQSYIDEKAYTFPVYFDTELEATYAYGATSLPVTYFVDAEGDIAGRVLGVINTEKLQKGIDMITK